MSAKKTLYKVKNWSEYNRSLINRGNITVWINEDIANHWKAPPEKKNGRPFLYSDHYIEAALTIGFLFGLSLRTTQGFLEGLISMLKLDLPVPHFTRLCRRSKSLNINYKVKKSRGPIDLVIDSTGLKVYGEGEWKMRVHGKSKRRGWKKVHLAVDPKNFQIVSMKLTDSKKADGKVLSPLLDSVKKIRKVYADAAYMYKECFEKIDSKGGKAIIDLRGGTSLARGDPTPGLKQRNRIVREIWSNGHSRKEWKKHSGYHRRSLVETQMFRWKQLLGSHLSSRKFENQVIEAKIKSKILNRLTSFGMPRTKAIAA